MRAPKFSCRNRSGQQVRTPDHELQGAGSLGQPAPAASKIEHDVEPLDRPVRLVLVERRAEPRCRRDRDEHGVVEEVDRRGPPCSRPASSATSERVHGEVAVLVGCAARTGCRRSRSGPSASRSQNRASVGRFGNVASGCPAVVRGDPLRARRPASVGRRRSRQSVANSSSVTCSSVTTGPPCRSEPLQRAAP